MYGYYYFEWVKGAATNTSQINLYIKKVGDPESTTIRLKQQDISNGYPSEHDIAIGTLSNTDVGTNMTWVNVTMNATPTHSGDIYIWVDKAGNSSNRYMWGRHTTQSSPYGHRGWCQYANCSGNKRNVTSSSFNWETYYSSCEGSGGSANQTQNYNVGLLQPHLFYGDASGASVTATISGEQKENTTVSGGKYYIDVRGNHTNYGQAVTIASSTASNSSYTYKPGETTYVNLL
jgi:hypothetical protein